MIAQSWVAVDRKEHGVEPAGRSWCIHHMIWPRMRVVLVATVALLCAAASSGTEEFPEVARIRAHILGAERLAARRDVSQLSPSARVARARLLRELEGYRRRGRFPENRDFPGQRMPYFIDSRGVRCAMAHLIECSGDSDLVRRIAATRNNARVRDLADIPELMGWLEHNGLSAEEAARIQPEYGYQPPVSEERPKLIAVTLGAEVGAIALNLRRSASPTSRDFRGTLGIGVGVLGALSGAWMLVSPEDHSSAWGSSCLALGITSVGFAVHQLRDPRPGTITAGAWIDAHGVKGLALRMAL
jgi:hypothetical protein